jgi:large subunit ribosomal protein L10
MDEVKKISANRQKKIEVVAGLSEKLGKSKAIVFTNYTGVTHKQLEALKRAIKPMQAEYVVAKNSLILRALDENKIKLEGENPLQGPTGTMLIYADVVEPLKQLAKVIKEIGLLNVKLGVMENKFLTGEQVLKISTLPPREVLLAQIAAGLKSPISGLHRALIWNLQKLVMTLGAIAKNKPAVSEPKTEQAAPVSEPTPAAQPVPAANPTEPESVMAETQVEKAAEQTPAVPNQPAPEPNITEPETIMAETAAEVVAEQPETDNPTIEAQNNEPTQSEGGEN